MESDRMAIPIPTVDDFKESTVMQECRAIVNYIINTLVPAINEGGGGSTYVLPPATKSTLGGIIVGDNLTVDESGKVNAPTPYILPIGGTNIGGVKNGGDVTIESDGTMKVNTGGIKLVRLDDATYNDISNLLSSNYDIYLGYVYFMFTGMPETYTGVFRGPATFYKTSDTIVINCSITNFNGITFVLGNIKNDGTVLFSFVENNTRKDYTTPLTINSIGIYV